MSYPSDGVQLFGPALPAPFVEHELKGFLTKRKLLHKSTGKDAKALEERWQVLRRKLGMLGEHGLGIRVRNHVLEPLLPLLGYSEIDAQETVRTREGDEDGGLLLKAEKAALRAWCWPIGTDLDAPSKRGHAFRFSPARVAQRVLLAKGERFGLLTDGSELRFLLCDPARPDSQMVFRLDAGRGGWRSFKDPPESFLLFLALARPEGLAALPELIEQARLHQSSVTKELRKQARTAIEGFIQGLLAHPRNAEWLAGITDRDALARDLWREGLAVVYRLLFILKLETAQDPARSFSFASTSAWRNTYSPSTALAPVVCAVLDGGETGGMLEGGLRALFRMFSREEGLRSSELRVSPLGGMLFGAEETRTIDGLEWGEQAVAALLDRLLWTAGKGGRERVHYGPLDVEDLGRVYEALLELEPGIATEPMCRLRRAKLEVVVPAVQGEPYRSKVSTALDDEDEDAEESDDGEDDAPRKGSNATVQWVEAIPAGRFFLRVGLGRKASGSYYTPHAFVRFLVQETLGPLVIERSPVDDPQPLRLLELKVLDPAMGSGHFLVEACRFLADKLYEACRSCDERASEAEALADKAKLPEKRDELLARAKALRERVQALPDPNDELLDYLPSRAPEGEEAGLSQRKAEALCRRLVAVHCLYGVDKNRLAVELAKLTLWLESYAEGLPLTFLDHRLVQGDSLTGPFFEQMLTFPGSGEPLKGPFAQDLRGALTGRLQPILEQVRALESTVGKDVADLERKRAAKIRLDAELQPFVTLARVWAGGVMLGNRGCDDLAYERLACAVGNGSSAEVLTDLASAHMYEAGGLATPYDLVFPEAYSAGRDGFDAVIGNPPWDAPRLEEKALLSLLDLKAADATRKADWKDVSRSSTTTKERLAELVEAEKTRIAQLQRALDRNFQFVFGKNTDADAPGEKDLYLFFCERAAKLSGRGVALVTGGGLAKNPNASGVRHLLFARSSTTHFFQLVNMDRSFGDLPQVVEFCLFVCTRRQQSNKAAGARRKLNLRSVHAFLEALGEPPGSPLVASPPSYFCDEASPPSSTLLSFIEKELGDITSELHKTADDDSYRSIAAVLEDVGPAPDGRLLSTRRALLQRGYAPLRGSRSLGVLNPLPEGLGGKRSARVDLCVQLSDDRPRQFWARAQYYRFAMRRHVGSTKTNERSIVGCVIPPGDLASDQLLIEPNPASRPNSHALIVAGTLGSLWPDAAVRHLVGTMVSKTILRVAPAPHLAPLHRKFLGHAAMRLVASDESFAMLWLEQFGSAWSEEQSPQTWPAIVDPTLRALLLADVNAVVADAYGLTDEAIEGALSRFYFKSMPNLPDMIRAAVEQLRRAGLRKFCGSRDPYDAVALPTTLPKPILTQLGGIRE